MRKINFRYITLLHFFVRVPKWWRHIFLHFSVLNTMYPLSMIENIHSQNLVGNGSWGLGVSKISVNWPVSKQLWTRPIYTSFNGLIKVFMRPYLKPSWTDSYNLVCKVFHHVLLKVLKCKIDFDDVTLQYSIHFSDHAITALTAVSPKWNCSVPRWGGVSHQFIR